MDWDNADTTGFDSLEAYESDIDVFSDDDVYSDDTYDIQDSTGYYAPVAVGESSRPSEGLQTIDKLKASTLSAIEGISSILGVSARGYGQMMGIDPEDNKVQDFFLDISGELAKKQADYQLNQTGLKDVINDPLKIGNFIHDLTTSTIPHLVGGFGTSKVGGWGAKKLASKYAKTKIEKLAERDIKDSMVKIASKNLKDDLDVALGKSYIEAAERVGRKVGMSSYFGTIGAGEAIKQDIALRGIDGAELAPAIYAGMGWAGLSLLGPVEQALAGNMSKGFGKKVLFSTTLKEAAQESSEEAILKLHEAGIDMDRTVGDVFTDPETLWTLSEAAVGGGLMGGMLGGVTHVINKGQKTEDVPEEGIQYEDLTVPSQEEADSLIESVEEQVAQTTDVVEDTEKEEPIGKLSVDRREQTYNAFLKGMDEAIGATPRPEVTVTDKDITAEDKKYWDEESAKAAKLIKDKQTKEAFQSWAKALTPNDMVNNRIFNMMQEVIQDSNDVINTDTLKERADKINKLQATIKNIINDPTPIVGQRFDADGMAVQVTEQTPETIAMNKQLAEKNQLQQIMDEEPEIGKEELKKAFGDPIIDALVDGDVEGLFIHLNDSGIKKGDFPNAIANAVQKVADLGLRRDTESLGVLANTGKDAIRIADKVADKGVKGLSVKDKQLLSGAIKPGGQGVKGVEVEAHPAVKEVKQEGAKEQKGQRINVTDERMVQRLVAKLNRFKKLDNAADEKAVKKAWGKDFPKGITSKTQGIEALESMLEERGVSKPRTVKLSAKEKKEALDRAKAKRDKLAETKKRKQIDAKLAKAKKAEEGQKKKAEKKVSEEGGIQQYDVDEGWVEEEEVTGVEVTQRDVEEMDTTISDEMDVIQDKMMKLLDQQADGTITENGKKTLQRLQNKLNKQYGIGTTTTEKKKTRLSKKQQLKKDLESANQQMSTMTDDEVQNEVLRILQKKGEGKELTAQEKAFHNAALASNIDSGGIDRAPVPQSDAEFVAQYNTLKETTEQMDADYTPMKRKWNKGQLLNKTWRKFVHDRQVAHKRMQNFISRNRTTYDRLVRERASKANAPTDEKKNPYLREDAKKITNAHEGLIFVRRYDTNETNRHLAKVLLDNVEVPKLKAMPVSVLTDPKEKTSFFAEGKVNMHAYDKYNAKIYLHEIVHSVTVREMKTNKALRDYAKDLLRRTRSAVEANGMLDNETLRAIDMADGSSSNYVDIIGDGLPKNSQIAYGLINEREFLAQALSSESFQNVLKEINVPMDPYGRPKTSSLWDHVVELFRMVFKRTNNTVLDEALKLTLDLANVDAKGTVDNSVNRIFAPVKETKRPMRDKLHKWRELREKGLSDKEVWQKTGIYKSSLDNKLRYEIDDSGAELDEQEVIMATEGQSDFGSTLHVLEDLLIHEELYKDYPELKEHWVEVINEPDKNWSGTHHTVPGLSGEKYVLNLAHIKNDKDMLNTLLHEIQHEMQDEGDFDRGMSPETVVNDDVTEAILANADKLHHALSPFGREQVNAIQDNSPGMTFPEAVLNFYNKLYNDYVAWDDNIRKKGEEASDFPPLKNIAKTERNIFGLSSIIGDIKHFTYQTRHGEMEAFETEYRQELTQEERAKQFPEIYDETADIRATRPWANEGATDLTAMSATLEKEVDRYPAYHGTHKRGIKEWDTSKIGTGEGAQVFGRGLYFAESRKVAGIYRDVAAKVLNQAYNSAQRLLGKNLRSTEGKEIFNRLSKDPNVNYRKFTDDELDTLIYIADGVKIDIRRLAYRMEESLSDTIKELNALTDSGKRGTKEYKEKVDEYFRDKRLHNTMEFIKNDLNSTGWKYERRINNYSRQLQARDEERMVGKEFETVKEWTEYQHAPDETKSRLQRQIETVKAKKAVSYLTALKNLRTSGRVYKVNIKPGMDEFLHLDEKIGEQSVKVRKALTELSSIISGSAEWEQDKGDYNPMNIVSTTIRNKNSTGMDVYRALQDFYNGNEEDIRIAEIQAGLKGHRFLDGFSRNLTGGEPGTTNTVVFRMKDVETDITRKTSEMQEMAKIKSLEDKLAKDMTSLTEAEWEILDRHWAKTEPEVEIDRAPRPKKTKLSPEEIARRHEAGLTDYVEHSTSWQKKAGKYMGSIATMAKKAIRGITDILEEINPELAYRMRKMEGKIRRKTKVRHGQIKNFIQNLEKLKDKEKAEMYFYLMNNEKGDIEKRHELLRKHGLTAEYKKVRTMLDVMNKEAKAVGLDNYPDIVEYFPRVVLDSDELIKAIKNDGEYGIIDAVIEEHLRKLGNENPSEQDKAQAITNLLKTGRFPAGIKEPSSVKKRSVRRVLSKWMKYYAKPSDALVSHVYEMTDAIEGRRLIGASKREQYLKRVDKINRDLEKKDKYLTDDEKETLIAEKDELKKLLTNAEYELDASISEHIAKLAEEMDLDEKQQYTIQRAIRARLNQKGMNGPMADLRNIGLITSLGNVMSTLTQLNDVVHSISEYGLFNTIGSILGNKTFSMDDLDLGHVMTELNSTTTSRYVDGILKLTGFKYLDGALKGVTMESAIKKARGMSRPEFFKKFAKEFGQDTEGIYEALHPKNGKLDKNNKMLQSFAFTELSKIQPVSMSEMPIGYNAGGNARILYTLKTYNLKILNRIINKTNKVFNDPNATREERMAAGKDLGKYTVLLVLAGASVDELKNWLSGDDEPFGDVVQDNLLKLFFLSRYTLDNSFRQGDFGSFLADILFPPLDIIEKPWKTAWGTLVEGKGLDEEQAWRELIPIFGKKPFTGGNRWDFAVAPIARVKNLKRNRQYIVDELKEANTVGEVRTKINEFNKDVRELNRILRKKGKTEDAFKVSVISAQTIKNARKKKREKERE